MIEVIEAIKKRKDVDLPQISVCKLLGCVGLKEWGIHCCDRIDEAELIDFENVFIDIENFPDILLSSIGMVKCKDLLLNYITKEQFENCFNYIVKLEEQVRNINNFAAILRKSTVRNLVTLYWISEKNDGYTGIKKYVLEEIKARLTFKFFQSNIQEWIKKIFFIARNYKLLLAIRNNQY